MLARRLHCNHRIIVSRNGVASHISVSVTPAGTNPTGFSPATSVGKPGGKSGFAALLAAVGDSGGAAGDAARKLESLLQPASDGTTNLAVPLSATADPAGTGAANGATATDAAGSAATSAAAAGAMKDLVDALAELQKTLQSGEAPSDDLLKRVKKAVDAVANVLAVQAPATGAVSAATTPDGTAAGAVGTSGSSSTTAADTAASDAGGTADIARASLAALDKKLADLAGAVGATHPDVAQKLTDLAATLDPNKLSSATLAQLGLGNASAPADTGLGNAIAALAAAPSPTAAATPQPALAAAQLKLPTDSSLTADSASKPSASAPAAASQPPAVHTLTSTAVTAAQNPPSGDSGSSKDPHDQKAADNAAAAAAATTSTPPDKAAPTQPAATAAVAATSATAATSAPAATTLTANAAYQTAQAVPLNLPQLAIDIARNAQQGATHFQVRLDPADLGRVNVTLSIDSTGATTAHLTAERADTLDLLRRDQGQLGAALSEAGLDAGKTNLQFSLSQNPFTRQDTGAGSGAPSYAAAGDNDDAADPVAPVATAAYRTTLAPQGLNIIV